MRRRNFLHVSSAAIGGSLVRPIPTAVGQANAAKPPWYAKAWRRAVIDMHIPDWDDGFFAKFDPDQYVDMLVKSRAQSIVCYAHSHVGLFNYPTKVGQQHKGWKGRDIVRELIEQCHKRDIAVVLYTSLIHDRWAFDVHPEWRMRKRDGVSYGEGSRYGVVCPNSAYREYVRSWVKEMCERYEFDGIRFDMTFWIGGCYCDDCQARWAAEVGGEMPSTVNWLEPRWVKFQRKREEWLADFAKIATQTVKQLRPQASVEHQSSSYPLNWSFGVAHPLVGQNDFLQGDFYGDSLQGSFVRKLLSELTPNRPFGYETSFSVELRDHTGRKSPALLEAKASAAIADHAAFIFIDAIDPDGQVNPRTHEDMGKVFERLTPYYDHIGGERVADIAIYYSLESKFSMKSNGQPVDSADRSDAHTEAAMNAAKRLLAAHLPFTVITKAALSRLNQFKAVLAPNVWMMDEEEVAAFRNYVRNGGQFYLSGAGSLITKEGELRENFMLSDVLGVALAKADFADREHYVSPTKLGQSLLAEWTPRYPAFVKGYGLEVEAREDTQVLATTTLPWPAPNSRAFSSIHSNPPWTPTTKPEIVLHDFGKGRAIYCASLVENVEGLAPTFERIVRTLCLTPSLEADAPLPVEITLFRQRDRGRYTISMVNFQKDLPNIPVEGLAPRLRLPETVRAVRRLPDGLALPFQAKDGVVSIQAPRLETLLVLEVMVT